MSLTGSHVLTAAALTLSACAGGSNGELKVAAAASLTTAYEELGKEFTRDTGKKVKFSFGSSGLLAQKLENGAPYDVYAAASMAYIDRVVKQGAAVAQTRTAYARGRLVVWTSKTMPRLTSLGQLANPAYRKISIANPDVAPYGKAARNALKKAGVWSAISTRIVPGSNVRQALQWAETGNAEAALSALSLALGAGGTYLLVDESLHDPLEQGIVVATRSKRRADAMAFIAFVNSPRGHDILTRHGLLQPGQSLPAKR